MAKLKDIALAVVIVGIVIALFTLAVHSIVHAPMGAYHDPGAGR